MKKDNSNVCQGNKTGGNRTLSLKKVVREVAARPTGWGEKSGQNFQNGNFARTHPWNDGGFAVERKGGGFEGNEQTRPSGLWKSSHQEKPRPASEREDTRSPERHWRITKKDPGGYSKANTANRANQHGQKPLRQRKGR